MRGGALAEAQVIEGTSAGVDELLTTGDAASDAGDGDPEVWGDGSQHQAVESDGGATEQGTRIDGRAAEARTGDLLLAAISGTYGRVGRVEELWQQKQLPTSKAVSGIDEFAVGCGSPLA